jgi:hypothetical protein
MNVVEPVELLYQNDHVPCLLAMLLAPIKCAEVVKVADDSATALAV